MTMTSQKIYELLPAIYRLRDSEKGGPLKALLSVISSQVELLEENLDQLYDDQFIETCADWVVPYIGDLIGYRPLHGVVSSVSSPRAEVANTIAFRRRKGTASMLEQLARDVTGWDARVVEFFQLLATTQFMNHVRRENLSLVFLKQWEPLENIESPFDSMAHLADVRRIGSSQGKYNIPNIGVFLWRIQAYPLTDSPAVKLNNDEHDLRYFFHPLAIDTPLIGKPERERDISHIAEQINVPMEISRRMLHEYLNAYYGNGKSFCITCDGELIDDSQIIACNLADTGTGAWAHQPPEVDDGAKVFVDPVLGRIALPQSLKPGNSVTVNFHYGFSADLGGGAYERADTFNLTQTPETPVIHIPGEQATILDAFQEASNRYANGHKSVVIEIRDNGRYAEAITCLLKENQRIELRAANGFRPTLVLQQDWEITGSKGAELILNGLLVCGETIYTKETLSNLSLFHCTLVPGLQLEPNGKPLNPSRASMVIDTSTTVVIEHCIIGTFLIKSGSVRIENSIVHATDPTRIAYAGSMNETDAGAVLQTSNTTFVGKVHSTQIMSANNCIFWSRLNPTDTWPAPVWCDRQQSGCIRFSYLPPNTITPSRYQCQPDIEIANEIERTEQSLGRNLCDLEISSISEQIQNWLTPQFTSLQYGSPGFAQLNSNCPEQIRTGAEDESEMGVFHDLYQPQRESNLRTRFEEYLKVGMQAGVFYAS
nr:hypothetical protein [uncultured Desulfobacter sp.]